MKIRNGFVSNSSSSSFIIGVRSKKDLSEMEILNKFTQFIKKQIKESSPKHSKPTVFGTFAKKLVDSITDINISDNNINVIKYIPNSGVEELEDIERRLSCFTNQDKNINLNNYKFVEGAAGDQDYPIPLFNHIVLSEEFTIVDDDILFYSGGPY